MLSLYHEVTTRGACTVKKELQIQQCCAVNSRLLRTVHSATCARFEHPLRYLEESSLMVLFQTAATEGPSTLNKCSMNLDRTPIPRMPWITDLSRFSTMGIRLSTCTTRTAPIWDSAKESRTKGLARSLLERSSHARESVVYTTDTNGLRSFRDRALFIYTLWAFISISACVGETATQQDNVLPLSSHGRPHVREESPGGATSFGMPKW